MNDAGSAKIPLVDLQRQYRSIEKEVASAVVDVMDRGQFILGENVQAFEQEFARYCGVEHAVGVASGTDALMLCLAALDLNPGDEVITVANTFVATTDSILYCGGKPVLVDADPRTRCMDVSQVHAAVTSKTRAIIPVHTYGHPVDMDPLLEFAEKRDIAVIEDACQGHGTEYKQVKAGSMGKCAAFSFYPSKTLGAYGDGGMVTSNDADLANRIRMLRNYGEEEKYKHVVLGFNSRLDEIQAAILRVKLGHLDHWINERRRVAAEYTAALAGLPDLQLPYEEEYARHSYYLYVVRTQRREILRNSLSREGISCGIHYPVPIHLQPAYRDLEMARKKYPVSEALAGEILSLPMFPELTQAEIDQISKIVRQCITSV